MDGHGIAPASSPSAGGQINSRASSAVAAASVAVILLYLFWRFVWQCKKGVPRRRNDETGAGAGTSASFAPRPLSWPCPSPTARGAGEAERGEMAPLPVFVHVAAGAEKAECAVCLVEFAHGEAGRVVPGCGHGFHAACIETWFRVKSTCPLCRAAVVGSADELSVGGAPSFERHRFTSTQID